MQSRYSFSGLSSKNCIGFALFGGIARHDERLRRAMARHCPTRIRSENIAHHVRLPTRTNARVHVSAFVTAARAFDDCERGRDGTDR